MTLALKPGWNAATAILTGIALLVEWPLALGVAAYAIWGDRLTGTPRHDTRPMAALGRWLTGRATPKQAPDSAAEAWHAAETTRINAELAAFAAEKAATARAEEQARFDAFLENRATPTAP